MFAQRAVRAHLNGHYLSPRRVGGPVMSLRRTAKGAIVARKRAAHAPLKSNGKDGMDASRVVEQLEVRENSESSFVWGFLCDMVYMLTKLRGCCGGVDCSDAMGRRALICRCMPEYLLHKTRAR